MAGEEQQRSISLQEAVERATNAVQELYEVQGYNLNDVLLEEIRRRGEHWEVTLGFTRPGTTSFSNLSNQRRAFKTVRLDRHTGEFVDMSIRELPSSGQQR